MGLCGKKSQLPTCILYIRPPCLALSSGISVSACGTPLPTSDELLFNTVERSLVYSLLIVSGKKVGELGKEALTLNFVLLGGISRIGIFPVAFEGPTSCFFPLCPCTGYLSTWNTLSFPFLLKYFPCENIFIIQDRSAPSLLFCLIHYSLGPLYVSTVPLITSITALAVQEYVVHTHTQSLSCLTLCDTMECSPPSFSVHGSFQARILEWVAAGSRHIAY